MIEVPLATVERLIRGALTVDRTASGIVPTRFPKSAAAQMPDAFTEEVFRQSSGVRLSSVTKASILEVDVCVSQAMFAEIAFPTQPPAFDLVIDGQNHRSKVVDHVSVRTYNSELALISQSGRSIVTLRFDDLPKTNKVLELWLAQNAIVELCAIRADSELCEAPTLRPTWIHYGSSISHCAMAHGPTHTWPAIAARLGKVELVNLGVGGNCHLDQFVARAIRDSATDCVSLKIGINIASGDTLKHRTLVPAIHGFLDTIRDVHENIPILVISPIICPMLENAPGPLVLNPDGSVYPSNEGLAFSKSKQTLTLRRMRELLADVVRVRSPEDLNLYYLDGLALFGEADLRELTDGVHPSADGYVRMGRRFARAAFSQDGCFGGLSDKVLTAD